MKIKKLVLKNYKHFKEQTIEFNDDINLIIGENNAGKTSLFYSIAAIFGLDIKENIDYDFPSKLIEGAFTTRIELTVSFSKPEWKTLFNIHKTSIPPTQQLNDELWEELIELIAEKDYHITFRLDVITTTDSRQTRRDAVTNDEIEILQIADSEIIPLLNLAGGDYSDKRRLIINCLRIIISRITRFPANNPFKPLILYPYNIELTKKESYIPFNQLRSELQKKKSDFKVRAQLHFLKEENSEEFGKFRDRMINYFKGIDQVDLEFDLKTGFLNLVVDTYKRDITLYGGGTKTFATIFSIISLKDFRIIMIDEPDAHLHTSLVNSLYEYLLELSKTKQIFITSHLPDFINLFPIDKIIPLNLEGLFSIVSKVENKPDLIYKMREMGLISNIFQTTILHSADKIVLCEGKYDGIFLEKFKTQSLLQLDERNIKYLPIGKRHSSELNKIQNLFQEIFIDKDIIYIRDRDEDTPEELEKLDNFNGFPVIVWNRRHIESYLLEVDSLAKLIRIKYPDREISEIIDQIQIIIDTEKQNQYQKLIYDYCENKLRKVVTPDRRIHLSPSSDLEIKSDTIFNALITRKIKTYTDNVNKEFIKGCVQEFDDRWSSDSLFMINAKKLLRNIRREFPLANFSNTDIIDHIDIIPNDIIKVLKKIYLN